MIEQVAITCQGFSNDSERLLPEISRFSGIHVMVKPENH
jgi:hypothetical protein